MTMMILSPLFKILCSVSVNFHSNCARFFSQRVWAYVKFMPTVFNDNAICINVIRLI